MMQRDLKLSFHVVSVRSTSFCEAKFLYSTPVSQILLDRRPGRLRLLAVLYTYYRNSARAEGRDDPDGLSPCG